MIRAGDLVCYHGDKWRMGQPGVVVRTQLPKWVFVQWQDTKHLCQHFVKELRVIKMKGLSTEEKNEIIPKNTMLLGYRGSIAHGTYIPSDDPSGIDDKDILGMCIAPIQNYYGLQKFEQREKQYKEWDSVVYEIRKYFSLLLKCNPNIMSLLWIQPNHYIIKTPLGQRILDNKHLFVSKKAYHSYNGYAYGQFKRMTHYRFEGYMGQKRKALVDKFGYDAKNAQHLIRLLRQGIEFLTEGELYVHRNDAEQLVSIKRGEWSLERVKKESERLFKLAEEAYLKSTLPSQPDYKKAEQLLVDILRSHFEGGNI